MQGALRLLSIALILSARVASAQDEAPPMDEEPPIDEAPVEEDAAPLEVRVIGDKADAMQKTPGSGTVIRPDEMQRAEPHDAAEILQRVPGVVVRQDPGAGGRLDIGLRGLDPGRSRRVLLLEDGIPISNNPYAEPDLYWAPPVERWQAVEVVKGSGNILFGPQTVGGVINFITPFAPTQRQVRLETKVGQRGFVQALGRYGDGHDDVRYLAQILYRRGDGFRAQGFSTVDALGKVSFPTGDTGQATLKVGLHDTLADADDVGLTTAMYAADPFRETLAPHDEQKLRRYDASLIHEQRFDEVVSLRTLAYAYSLERVWRRQDYTRFAAAGVAYERVVGDPTVPNGAIFFEYGNRVLDRSYQVAGLEPRLELRFATGAVSHTLDIGARVLGEGAQYEQRAGERPRSYSGALELDETHTTVAAAGYVQDRIGFFDEFLLVTPGVRVEYAHYTRRLDRQPTASGAEDVAAEGESDTTGIIPGIGMTLGTPDIHGFGGVHVGWAPPRVTSAIRASGETEELGEERSVAYELGMRAGQRRVWHAEATGFLNGFFNQVVPSSGDELTLLVNGGATRHMGIETAAGISFGHFIAHGVLLDLGGRYTFMSAEFVGGPNKGNDLPYAPHHVGNVTLDAGHDIGIAAQLSYGFVGPQFTDDLNTVDADVTGRVGRIPAYHRLDANLRYTHAATGLTALVSVKDLLDRPFIISRRPEGIFAAGFRQVIVGLRWDYAEMP